MENLKNIRLECGYKQTQLAEILGIPVTTLSNYERGERAPSFKTLCDIARFFGVSTDYLLGFSNQKEGALDIHTPEEFELLTKFRKLNQAEQGETLDFIRFKLHKQEEKDALKRYRS